MRAAALCGEGTVEVAEVVCSTVTVTVYTGLDAGAWWRASTRAETKLPCMKAPP